MHSKYLRRAGLAAVLATLGLIGVPAVAAADSVAVQGSTLKLTLASSNGEKPRAFVEQSGDTFTVTDYNTGMTGCDPGEYNEIQVRRCTAPGITRVVVTGTSLAEYVEFYASLDDDIVTDTTLGGGDDQVEDQSGGRSIVDAGEGEDDVETYGGADEIHGGPGLDDLGGGDGDDEIFGDAGNDTIFGVAGADTLHGGAGDDHLYGGDDADHVLGDADQDDLRGNSGPDTLDGGAGDDDLEGSDAFDDVSPDVLAGGPGVDTANYADRDGSGTTTEVSLDGLANDGLGGPAEGDDVGPDGSVENVMIDDFGTRAVLTGDDGPNELDAGFTVGGAAVDGRGGDDVLTGSSDPVTGDVLHGGGDDDTIEASSGPDEAYGDGGDDDVDGNSGDDYVEGGSGTDHIHGGNGDDAVEAQDDGVDAVSCGDGADVASIDSVDVLDASPFEVCEAKIVHVVDTTPPQTALIGGPAEGATIAATTATFGFTADDDGARFECKLDGGAFTACGDGRSRLTLGSVSYSGLAQGAHTFTVRAIDASDNVDPSPAVRHFTVDTVAPETSLGSGGPAAGSTQTTRSATFTFSSPDHSASFQCKLDGAGYAACPGGSKSYANLADGSHTFSVKARDAAGNEDGSPVSRTWTIDATAPPAVIDAGPAQGARMASDSTTFAFHSEAGAKVECRLDGGAFADCASGSASYADLAEGSHTFTVRATDQAGNAASAVRTWTVDTMAPETSITSGPAQGSSQTTTAATFGFAASEAASFRCRIDGGGSASCASPKRYSGLSVGSHTFSVVATDAAGNTDASPSTRTFTVTAPSTPPGGGGGGDTGGGGGDTGGGDTGGGTDTPSGPSTAALKSGVSKAASAATKAVKKAGLKTLAKKGSYSRKVKMPGKGAYAESVTAKAKGKRKPVKFAAGREHFAKATSGKVKVKLTAKGKKLAKKSRKLKLTVTTTFKAAGEKPVKKTKTVTVKR